MAFDPEELHGERARVDDAQAVRLAGFKRDRGGFVEGDVGVGGKVRAIVGEINESRLGNRLSAGGLRGMSSVELGSRREPRLTLYFDMKPLFISLKDL